MSLPSTRGAVRVGVTGHRAFDVAPDVLSAIDRALEDAASDGRRLVVYTAFADGADRVVVERALARQGSAVVAVLPLHASDYEEDFDDQSVLEFRRLLERAEDVTVTGPGPDGSRESAYERAGRAVVDSSDMLIALWDGLPSRGRGGTAEVVEYAKNRGVAVVVVPVRRTSGSTT